MAKVDNRVEITKETPQSFVSTPEKQALQNLLQNLWKPNNKVNLADDEQGQAKWVDNHFEDLVDTIVENGIKQGRFTENQIASLGQRLHNAARGREEGQFDLAARTERIIGRIRRQNDRMLRPGISEQPGVDRGYVLGSTAGEADDLDDDETLDNLLNHRKKEPMT